jgi:hypothetical protein
MTHPDHDIERLLRDRRHAAPPDFTVRVLRRVAAERQAPRRAARVFSSPRLTAAAVLVLALGLSLAGLFRAKNEASDLPRIVVELELAEAGARSVAVAGDFNNWDAVKMQQGSDGVWRVRLSLPPGRYQYAFVVDEEKWVADPRATAAVDSGYSGTNSVLDVAL